MGIERPRIHRLDGPHEQLEADLVLAGARAFKPLVERLALRRIAPDLVQIRR